MAPIIESVKTCALGRQRPFSPSVPAEAGCLSVAGVHVFVSGESLLVVIFLWLVILFLILN